MMNTGTDNQIIYCQIIHFNTSLHLISDTWSILPVATFYNPGSGCGSVGTSCCHILLCANQDSAVFESQSDDSCEPLSHNS